MHLPDGSPKVASQPRKHPMGWFLPRSRSRNGGRASCLTSKTTTPPFPCSSSSKDLQSTLFKDTSTWAKGALPVAKQKQEKLRARVTAACEKARKLLKEYHYGEVSEMLEGLPLPARTDEARRLLKLAGEAFDDYMGLQQEIDDALKAKNYEHLLPLVKRYIKLKPDNSKMQRLAQDLARNRPDRAVKNYKGTGKYFDVASLARGTSGARRRGSVSSWPWSPASLIWGKRFWQTS